MRMGQQKKISGYVFQRVSATEYSVTAPNGATTIKYYTAAENLMKQLEKKASGNNIPKSEVYTQDQPEYHRLRAFAEALNAFQNKLYFDVQICYKDYGTGLKWTTIIARKQDGTTFMYFTPAKQTEVLNVSYTEFSKLISTTLSELKKG